VREQVVLLKDDADHLSDPVISFSTIRRRAVPPAETQPIGSPLTSTSP
jgi:hypothetical protein